MTDKNNYNSNKPFLLGDGGLGPSSPNKSREEIRPTLPSQLMLDVQIIIIYFIVSKK